ncbi:MAG: PAS domain S-box protein [Marinilabiliaceae bacterium]
MASSKEQDSIRQAKLDRFCIDHAGVGIYSISEQSGRILSVNRQACIDTGYSENELLSMTVFDLDTNFPKQEKEKWHRHRKKIRSRGTGTFESLHRRKDGTLMPVEVTVSYIKFEGENISFSFVRDISRRKQAEEALRQSEKLFRTTLYSIGDAVITCDLKGNVLNLNTVAEKLTGWKESDARGNPIHTIFRIINENTRETVESPVEKVYREGRIVGLANHTLLVARDGTETPISDSGAPIFSDDGSITGVVLVFRDQTEERQYQQELENNRKYLSTLLNNLPGMAFRCLNKPSWDMEYVSRGCEDLTGYKPHVLMTGRQVVFGELIHPDDRQRVWEEVQQAVKERRSYEVEYRIITREKTSKWVWEQGEAIISQEGEVEAIEGFITDISDRKHYEKKLQENDRLKTAFLQNVSHEIRTPLNAVIGFSDLIRDDMLSSGQRNEYIDIVQASGHKLLGILNNVLELSRIETGDVVLNPSELHLNKFLQDIYAFFRPQAHSKNLEFTFIRGEEKEITIHTDPSKLDQVMTNLISNAIKYTEEGQIQFGYTRKQGELQFFVQDTGPGITKEHQARVFDRFYRSNEADPQLHDGVGLGLSICLELIELLNGKIWLESAPEKGTCFYFSLPWNNT